MSNKEKEFLREFIELYQSFPCLWKIKCREYSDRNAKAQAYNILIEKLQTVNPEANRDSVVKKINSLRTTYRKELKRVLESERSGAGVEDIYVPNLWYYESMNFIRDQEIPRNTKSNIEDTQLNVSIFIFFFFYYNKANYVLSSLMRNHFFLPRYFSRIVKVYFKLLSYFFCFCRVISIIAVLKVQ